MGGWEGKPEVHEGKGGCDALEELLAKTHCLAIIIGATTRAGPEPALVSMPEP